MSYKAFVAENLHIAYDHMIMSNTDSSFSSRIIEYKRKKRQPLSTRCVGDHIVYSTAYKKKKERVDFSPCSFVRLSERVQSDYPIFFLSFFPPSSSFIVDTTGRRVRAVVICSYFFFNVADRRLTYIYMVLRQVKIFRISRFTS
jgi:hypothetical protein